MIIDFTRGIVKLVFYGVKFDQRVDPKDYMSVLPTKTCTMGHFHAQIYTLILY